VGLVGRLLWVILSFLLACVAAGTVTTLGFVLPELSQAALVPAWSDATCWAIALTAALIAGYAFIPAMLLISLAEGFRLRSFVFYSIAGAVTALLLAASTGGGSGTALPQVPLGHDREVLLASGIAGGLIYWALAGRNAGTWRRRHRQQHLGTTPGQAQNIDQDSP